MKSLYALGSLITAVVWLPVGAAAQGVPSAVHFITHDKLEAMIADRSKRDGMVDDPGLRIMANTREAGPAELHERTNHIFIMKAGEGTFVTGGKLIGAKRTAPNEMRADGIEGGQTYHLTKGDIITIPAKTPHWMKEAKDIEYYVVNIEN
jgi:mannose-6-phosphate isomerase-like protein (cupin superfamily)